MTGNGKKSAPLFSGDPFEQIIAIVMTLIVIQTAVISFWFTLSDDSDGDAGRDAQMYALQGLGTGTVGSMRSGYDQSTAYQRWLELDVRARLADQQNQDDDAVRLRTARDRVVKLSPLLNAPYFDPARSLTPNTAAYNADTFLVQAVALSERFENQARLKNQWSDRSGAYTVMLTVLAVTLFLLGISGNSPRRMRLLFFGVGVVLALGVLVWMLTVYFQPVSSYPDEAIDAYARGIGKYTQKDMPAAVAELDRAVELEPAYTRAYRDRAVMRYLAGDVGGAAADFEFALTTGDTSSETASGLGFVKYLLGHFDQAKPLHESAVKGNPDEMWMRANAAVNLLASGEIEAARREYEGLLAGTLETVNAARTQGKQAPASLWYDFDASATDLHALAACASTQVCDGAPPFVLLKNPAEIARAAGELETRLKEYSVALEYTGQPPPPTSAAQVEPFLFTRELAADTAPVNGADTFTATDEPVYVFVRFRTLQDGQKIVIKVYLDNVEDDRLRVQDTYSLQEMGGADGDFFLSITTGGIPLSVGKYRVEMFVDSKLMQTGEFQVVAENPTEP